MEAALIPEQLRRGVEAIKADKDPVLVIPGFYGTLLAHQKVAVLHACYIKRHINMDEVGIGKTVEALAGIAKLMSERKKFRVLIAVEGSAIRQWQGEIEKFLHLTPQMPLNEGASRKKIYELCASRDQVIVLVNTAKLHVDFDLIQDVLRPDMVVVDEAAILSNKNKTAQHAGWIAKKTEFAWLLTAEPLTRGDLTQLRNLFEIIGISLMESEAEFIEQFVEMEYRTVNARGRFGSFKLQKGIATGTKNMDEFKYMIAPWAIRRTRASLGADVRIINRQLVTVELTPTQRERYLEVKKQVLTVDGAARQLQKISTAIYIAQILNSVNIVDKSAPADSPKAEALAKLCKMLGDEKIVVFSKWKDMHGIIAKHLTEAGIRFRLFSGDLSNDERWAVQSEFTKDPTLQVIVLTEAGQRGLNLQVAHTMVFLDILYSPASMRQLIGRLDRHGQVATIINLYFIVADRTTEIKIFSKLKDRQSVTDAVFDEDRAGVFNDNFSPEEMMVDLDD